jgi:hypothetical protein
MHVDNSIEEWYSWYLQHEVDLVDWDLNLRNETGIERRKEAQSYQICIYQSALVQVGMW